MTNPNDVLPRDIAREFGRELLELSVIELEYQPSDDVLESLGRIAFKVSLEIAEQIDFGSENVR